MRTPAEQQGARQGFLRFYAWSLVVALVTGLAAIGFRGLTGIVHNLLFLGRFSFVYDANVHTPPSPWGPFVIFVPVIGAIGVVFLVKNFAPEAKGHGVPEVMDAVYYHGGVIRPIVAAIKWLASGLSIGSGGSIGREGPIIQIGASFGSTLAQLVKVSGWQRITLIAAGGGAGLAATFNTPLGGVLFAVEILLTEVSARTLVPVIIATVTAAYISRLVFGASPAFVMPPEATGFHAVSPYMVPFFFVLGITIGLASVLYIRCLYWFEDFFEARISNYYLRHTLGMAIVGAVIYGIFRLTGHYQVEGVGYATVQDVLADRISWVMLLLFACKLITTSLTLGTGASGGVFSPALFMGATLGGVFGMAAHEIFPDMPIHPIAFAVAGMAGMIGASTGAAITGVVMIFEMTQDYHIIIPVTVTVALSYGVRTLIQPQSIYTVKLARRGHVVPSALHANLFPVKRASEVMNKKVALVPAEGTLVDLARALKEQPNAECFIVQDSSGIVGFLPRTAAEMHTADGEQAGLGELADRHVVEIAADAPLIEAMSRMQHAGAALAVVVDGGEIKGVIMKANIADTVLEATEMFAA